jgi:hypothetical protein
VRAELGWAPVVDFQSLIERMVDADMERLGAGVGPLVPEGSGVSRR